jgi:hypothetical protein
MVFRAVYQPEKIAKLIIYGLAAKFNFTALFMLYLTCTGMDVDCNPGTAASTVAMGEGDVGAAAATTTAAGQCLSPVLQPY